MSEFERVDIIDENGNSHELFTTYIYGGETYYITRDNKLFSKENEIYKEVDQPLLEEILKNINDTPKIIEYYDKEI